MSTCAQLAVKCAARFRDPSNRVVTEAQWEVFLNEAYAEVNDSTPLWPWLESAVQTGTVTAGTRALTLAAGVFQVNWVYDTTDNWKLAPLDGAGAQYTDSRLVTDTGAARSYRLRAGTLELYPLVEHDTALSYEAVAIPAPMATGDTPVWGVGFDQVLIAGAVAKAYLDDGASLQFGAFSTSFQSGLKAMQNFYLAFRNESYPTVRDTFFDD